MPWLVALALFMPMLSGTILNTALPGIGRALNVSTFRMHLAIVAYMLVTAMLVPVSGWLAERWGTRRTFCLGIACYTSGAVLCSMSNSLEFLVFGRAVQGLGGAVIAPVGRLIILKAYPRDEFVRLLSFITLPGMLGPLLGPATGGFLVQYLSWHWIFLINVPLGVLGVVLSWIFIPEMVEKEVGRFDLSGFLLFSSSIVLLSLGMEGFGMLHRPRIEAASLCVVGLLLMTAYWLRDDHGKQMLFSRRIFATRSFSIGILGSLFARFSAGAVPFLNPMFLQLGLGFPPFQAGLFMMPIAFGALFSRGVITILVKKLGFRAVLIYNTLLLGSVICSFSLITPNTPAVLQLLQLACLGTVNSIQFMTMNSFTLIELPPKDTASGNSLLSVSMQISLSMGVTVAATLLGGFTSYYTGGQGPARGETLIQVFHSTFIVIGLMAVVASCIFSWANPELGKNDRRRDKATGTANLEGRKKSGMFRAVLIILIIILLLVGIAACYFALCQLGILTFPNWYYRNFL